MLKLESLADIDALRETCEVECKLARGRDAQGKLPDDFWPTYSAFANSKGGCIVLGVRQRSGFRLTLEDGIPAPDKVRFELFNLLANPQKVSCSVVGDDDVVPHVIEGKTVLAVTVRKATRKERPVFIGPNPFEGTFRRTDSGDRICDKETVRRWLAEQQDDGRDSRALKGFSAEELDSETIERFRQALSNLKPGHPFLDVDGEHFLRRLKAFAVDREAGFYGVTPAGLLMFGRYEHIQDEFPNFMLDYRELDASGNEVRRITPDGSWSGNVFDFYRRAYRWLVEDLKVPRLIKDGVREEDTPVHKALREALVNALVHSDYTGAASVRVIKRSSGFSFRNPGDMRVPPESAIAGGESDCRNRALQQMFFLIGAGEKEGAGIPRIYKGWAWQHWVPPTLVDDEPKNETRLDLRMVDLIDPEVLARLRDRFGPLFEGLSGEAKTILACAETEGDVTHARAMQLCSMHPADLSKLIQGLAKDGYFLRQIGKGKGSRYEIPPSAHEDFFSPPTLPPTLPREGGGYAPDLLDRIAKVRGSRQAFREDIEAILLSLCQGRFMSARELAAVIGRSPGRVQEVYLREMVADGRLVLRYPEMPGRRGQGYRVAGT